MSTLNFYIGMHKVVPNTVYVVFNKGKYWLLIKGIITKL